MASLYVDRKGVTLELRNSTLVFYENGARAGAVPLAPIERVFLRGDVQVGAGLLGRLGEMGIGVVVLSGRKAAPTMLLGRPHNDAARRLAQYRRALDARFCLAQARRIVAAKLGAQSIALERLAAARPMERYLLRRAMAQLRAMAAQAENAESVSSLRGLEGSASAAYFAALASVVPQSLGFKGRNRQPPRDPFNAVLSLTYTMLHAEAVLAAYGGGLDPFVGFYHGVDFGRESLACDLMEPLRPDADAFALSLFNRRLLRAEDFSQGPEGCFLGKTGRERFYGEYDLLAEIARKALTASVRDLIAELMTQDALCPTT